MQMSIPSLRRTPALPKPKSKGISGLFPYRKEQVSGLVDVLKEYLDEQAVQNVCHAYEFSASAHDGQLRRSGEPYVYHPLAVARILADMRLDSRSVMAALLHDVIEDTPTAKEHLAEQFGKDVADLVDGVSKINQIEFESKEEAEAENFRKMLMAMSHDIRVILIKLADRLHNMRTLGALRADKRQKIAKQTIDIYAPIANRLGMYRWSRELEDLSFTHLHPKRYRTISKALKKRQGNRKSVVKKLRDSLEKQLAQGGLNARVMGREKNIFSIYRKMQLKRTVFDSIQDIYGFRVIVDSVEDCYRALGVIHNLYKPVPGRFKDYIAIPKVNGYQSLHTVVFGTFGESFEVQIRTEPMHRIAESGVASHWQYKTDKSSRFEPTEIARKWLLDLLDTQPQAGSNPGEFLEHLKIDLFPDAVYVFTPKGDIKKLPQGATALDFAYAVHSDIGNRCVGARVNHTLVPLHTVLRNGDHVESLTSRSAHPTPSWLKFAMTSKARAAIRSYLKKQQGKDSIRLGKRLLDRELKALKWSRRKIGTKQRSELLETLRLASWDDLLVDIGLGNRLPNVVARQLVPSGGEETTIDQSNLQPLEIHGAEGMLISYARCCRPIPGDSVIGFLTTGRGITVHTSDCPNIGEYRKHPDKWLHIAWAEEIDGEYPVNIRVDVENRRGVLADLAATIAEQGSNIENITTVERDSLSSTLNFTIGVNDRIHLAQILRQLRVKEGVLRISRVKG